MDGKDVAKMAEKPKLIHRISFTLLIAFAVISFWRGVWGLMDLYLFPNNYQLSLWISLFLGLLMLIIVNSLTQELIY